MLWTFSPQMKPHRFIDQGKNLCPSMERIQKTMAPHHLPALDRDVLVKEFPPPTTAHFYSASYMGGPFFTAFLSSLLFDKMRQPSPRQQRSPPCYSLRGRSKEFVIPTTVSYQLGTERRREGLSHQWPTKTKRGDAVISEPQFIGRYTTLHAAVREEIV